MRIAFVISSLANKAPVKLLLDIAQYQVERGNNVYVITLNPESSNSLISQFLKVGVLIHSLNYTKLQCELFSFKVRKLIEKYMNDNNIQLVHCSCYNSVVICSKIKSIMKSLTFHNYCTEDYVFAKGKIIGSYMAYRFMKAAKRFEYPIAISKSMKAHYEILLKKEISYIYNGIDNSLYRSVEISEKNSIREKLGFGLTEKIFLVSGYLIPRKNPLFIIKAFIKANIPNAKLVFIGDGKLMEECKNEAKQSKANIEFRGFVANIHEYLKASDCFISASFSEGFPLSVIEALSTGLVLILSDIPPHKEIVDNSVSDNNAIYTFKTEEQLIQLIKDMLRFLDLQKNTTMKKNSIYYKKEMVVSYDKLFNIAIANTSL